MDSIKSPEPNSLWRFKRSYHNAYKVIECDQSFVYYCLYNVPNVKFKKEINTFISQMRPLTIDEVVMETGGIF